MRPGLSATMESAALTAHEATVLEVSLTAHSAQRAAGNR